MDFSMIRLSDIIVHHVGIRDQQEELVLAGSPLEVSPDLASELKPYFLHRFGFAYEQYRFESPSGFPNPVLESVRQLFAEEDSLTEASGVIARSLYEAIIHPKVKPGELVVVRFDNYPFEGRTIRAIGIFKMENKSRFLEVVRNGGPSGFNLIVREGSDLLKTDKGCLVLEEDEQNGYVVMITDPNNRGSEARYWKENFLGLRQRPTSYSQTTNILAAAREFVTNAGQEMESTEKMEVLDRSMAWFQERETFNQQDFEKEVFQDAETIRSFRQYARERMPEISPDEEFIISAPAVKKQARVFKSILKLDRNFHIYIHGNRELIQRGVDPDGRKYYKIYFTEES